MNKYLFSSLLLLSLSAAKSARAHPYLPLLEGYSSTSQYHFQVQGGHSEQAPPTTNGSIMIKTSGWEEHVGKKYLRFVTSYQDIPYMKDDAFLWRREEDGNIYLGHQMPDKFVETLELSANVELGSHWDYDDGQKSVRTVTAKIEFDLPNGEHLSDCIEVTRTILNNEALKDVKDQCIYCRDRGNVRTIFVQPSPVGTYRTETIQTSRKANS